MLDFITVPLIVGTLTWGIYKLFDSLIRRKERLKIIEKIEDMPPEFLKNGIMLPSFNEQQPSVMNNRFSPFLICGLLIGIGLGLMVITVVQLQYADLFKSNSEYNSYYVLSAFYGACVLFFGGLGLLSAFFVERALKKKDNK